MSQFTEDADQARLLAIAERHGRATALPACSHDTARQPHASPCWNTAENLGCYRLECIATAYEHAHDGRLTAEIDELNQLKEE